MNQQQWHEWRRQGIGSSDAAVVMNTSPWKTQYQLWEEKVLGKYSQVDNSSMQRGRALEETARQEFEKIMDVSVLPRNVVHPQHDFMRASLDGMDMDNKVMVEIKCPDRDDHMLAIDGKVPQKYVAQCQHQLLVTGLSGMYYFSFDGKKGVIVEVPLDQKYAVSLLENEADFWKKVMDQTPPELTDKDFKNYDDHEKWKKASSKWQRINKEIKRLEHEEKLARNELLEISQGRNAEGMGIRLSRSLCKGAIDYASAISDYMTHMKVHYPNISFPEIELESYRKDSYIKSRITSY